MSTSLGVARGVELPSLCMRPLFWKSLGIESSFKYTKECHYLQISWSESFRIWVVSVDFSLLSWLKVRPISPEIRKGMAAPLIRSLIRVLIEPPVGFQVLEVRQQSPFSCPQAWSTSPSRLSERPLEDLLLGPNYRQACDRFAFDPLKKRIISKLVKGKQIRVSALSEGMWGPRGVVAVWFGASEEISALLFLPLMKGLAVYPLEVTESQVLFFLPETSAIRPRVEDCLFLVFLPFHVPWLVTWLEDTGSYGMVGPWEREKL